MNKIIFYIFVFCSITRLAGADLWSDLAPFKAGDDITSPPARINELIVKTPPEKRDEIEDKLIDLLKSPDTTDEAKWFCCRMLQRIGTEKCVPTLAGLLHDKRLSHYARLTLERMTNSDTAGQSLIDALPKAPDHLKIGIMGSLAARDEKKAVQAIAQFADSDNVAVAKAALQTIEKISPRTMDATSAYELFTHGNNPGTKTEGFIQLCKLDPGRALIALDKTSGALRPDLLRIAMEMEHSTVRNDLVDSLPQRSVQDQQVILGALADLRLYQYENQVLALLSDSEFNDTVVYTLGLIGGEDSFEPLYKIYQIRPEESLTLAISQLPAPSVDTYLLEIVRNHNDLEKTLGAITPLVLRNPDGAADALNVLAEPNQPEVLRKAAYKALETIGNTNSGKLFTQAIMKQDEWMRPAQLSLKRLSINMGEPQLLWQNVFHPALKSAPDNPSREGLLAILDGIPSEASLKYLEQLIESPNNPLRAAALRSLSRWPEFDAGDVWVNMLKSDQVTEDEIDMARRGIVRILTVNKIQSGKIKKFELAVRAIQAGPTATFKQSILASLKVSNKYNFKKERKIFESLLNDPDVGEQVQIMLISE